MIDFPATPTDGQIIVLGDNKYKWSAATSQWKSYNEVATGGGTDTVFFLNSTTVTQNYTLPANTNAMTAGPITVSDSVTVTIPDGCTWTII